MFNTHNTHTSNTKNILSTLFIVAQCLKRTRCCRNFQLLRGTCCWSSWPQTCTWHWNKSVCVNGLVDLSCHSLWRFCGRHDSHCWWTRYPIFSSSFEMPRISLFVSNPVETLIKPNPFDIVAALSAAPKPRRGRLGEHVRRSPTVWSCA